MPCCAPATKVSTLSLFHAALLWHRATLSPLDQELLLSDAVLSFADALARGAVPVECRRDDEILTPEPIDVAAVLDAAFNSSNQATVIEALAPTTPTYRTLRQDLQMHRSGDQAATNRLRTIEVNLERQRWLPRRLPTDRVWVNVADERLVLYHADQSVFSTRVVVGQDAERNQSVSHHDRRKLFQPYMRHPERHRYDGDPAEDQPRPGLFDAV